MPTERAPIAVKVLVRCDPATAWRAFTQPASVMQWNFAVPEWHCPQADNDLRVGGHFCYRMEARDRSMGFDFEGRFTEIVPNERLAFTLGPERRVVVTFRPAAGGTEVTESFTPDPDTPLEMQQAGWQSILDNYRRHAEQLP